MKIGKWVLATVVVASCAIGIPTALAAAQPSNTTVSDSSNDDGSNYFGPNDVVSNDDGSHHVIYWVHHETGRHKLN